MATNRNFELSNFWELEEMPETSSVFKEKQDCEDHFTENITQDESGRYIVALPFKNISQRLGNSYGLAFKRFLALERKFKQNNDLKLQYSAVIQEYMKLGHMSEVKDYDENDGFFLLHHVVIKRASLTTKGRVIFGGSAKSSTGISLNEKLMTAPVIQDDIFTLLLRFRMHNFVFTADIEKMYRQFLVRKSDRKKNQRTFWRVDESIKVFELNTVTFGLAPSSFLAIRCIHKLAEDHKEEFPRAAKVLKQDVYVDDVISGARDREEANQIVHEIVSLLKRAQLNIRKWASNDSLVLKNIDN